MRYYSFNEYLKKTFHAKVYRLSLDAGFTCPNRDGKVGTEGCVYCNEEGFAVYAGSGKTLKTQIEESMVFVRKKYKAEKFIAYFQNATNTYASADKLKETYDVIKGYPDIVGLYISTRPDCVDAEKLDLIKQYLQEYDVWIEYGVQSAKDATLSAIGRGHDFAAAERAIHETAERGIKAGAHVILGLPGETADDMIDTMKKVSAMPVSGIKFHVLHVLKNTRLEEMYRSGKINLLSMGEYANIVCECLGYTSRESVIFRLVSDAARDVLVAPEWVNDKQKAIRLIEETLERKDIYQGKYLS
ncbi:MAG TPA: TIGR01212 family radical SAM protein [Candidatus Omnitrophota bacterium]|nr:TIGR01212 family radical SAM protein [Candidatus Omnitrophota bacterium]HPS20938.1 TIGR01212 family radical SAM protein [Candidatus Omnitrophota bacterium]